ncbi:hypothetical protein K2X05_00115 [bacterium]|nr:hypothetical protein [bacterium]
METYKKTPQLLFLLLICLTKTIYAESYAIVEGSQIWQSRNDQRVPGNSGTPFSLSDVDSGPFYGYRVYAGYILNQRHEFRALYAPLEIKLNSQFAQPVNFENVNFAANTSTDLFYKFNSYRLTYAYHFDRWNNWLFALGFTGKVRDAEVRLSQSGLVGKKSNVGFVPLLNFQARYEFSNQWQFRFDLDGLAAPQGRAIDAAFFLDYKSDLLTVFGGYRTIEGGADNDKVYNFAWFHQAVVGLWYDF